MKVECKESHYFFDVIIATIKGESIPTPPKDMNWDLFLKTVIEQQFVSLIASALENNSEIPADVLDELKKYKNNEFKRILFVQNEFNEIKDMLISHGIRYMPLKGSIIKTYYPKSSYRQMTDIDLLCDYAHHNTICEYMLNRGYTQLSDGGNTDDFTKAPYYTFEFHHDLFKDVYGFCPDFSFVWDNAKLNGVNEYEYDMSPEDVYLHSIAHMYKHFILGGFGIKFIVDNYILVTANESSWDRKYIDKKLVEMKIFDFERQVVKASFDFFDHNLTKEQSEFFQKAFRYGTFCDDEDKSNVEEIFNNYQKDNSSVFKYVFLRIFPPKYRIKSMYPILNEKPYLYPWFYIKRLFIKIFKGPKKVFRELNYIFKAKKNKE